MLRRTAFSVSLAAMKRDLRNNYSLDLAAAHRDLRARNIFARHMRCIARCELTIHACTAHKSSHVPRYGDPLMTQNRSWFSVSGSHTSIRYTPAHRQMTPLRRASRPSSSARPGRRRDPTINACRTVLALQLANCCLEAGTRYAISLVNWGGRRAFLNARLSPCNLLTRRRVAPYAGG